MNYKEVPICSCTIKILWFIILIGLNQAKQNHSLRRNVSPWSGLSFCIHALRELSPSSL